MDAECESVERAILLRVHPQTGVCLLEPAEAEQLAADLLRASAAARAFVPPVSEAVEWRVQAARVARAKCRLRRKV